MSRTIFVAWARLSRRTRDLARELDAKLVFIPDRPPYIRAWRKTKTVIESEKPDIVLIQLPQGPLLWRITQLSKKLGFHIVADVHSGFIVYNSVKELLLNALFRKLLHQADFVLSHNPPFTRLLIKKLKLHRDKVLTVYDPLPKPPKTQKKPAIADELDNYIVIPASWAPDEPLEYIAKEFLASKVAREYQLVITGNLKRNPKLAKRIQNLVDYCAKKRVILSGYLDDAEYSWLIHHSQAIIAATTKEYTMLSAIWESIAYNKLFLVSRTATLKEVIGNEYPCFFTIRRGEIARVIDSCMSDKSNIRKHIEHTFNNLINKSISSLNALKSKLYRLV